MTFNADWFQAPRWNDPDVDLFHGTSSTDVDAVLDRVDLNQIRGRRGDFGRGLYTTTSFAQAEELARVRAWRLRHEQPRPAAAVVAFAVPRFELARLRWLAFVRSEPSAEDYWQFVGWCRKGQRALDGGGYDVVVGPVAAEWQQREAWPDSDQIAFISERAVSLIRNVPARRIL